MDSVKIYFIPLALLFSSLIIGASFVYNSDRDKYEISTSPLGVFRLDKSTGKIDYCNTRLIDNMKQWLVDCSGTYTP